MPMAFKLRSSKYRHVYGSPFRREQSYENVRITQNAHDSHFCAVNPLYMSVVTESAGGGSFLVLPTERAGRVDMVGPKVSGHAGAVLDIKWNPFDDHMIASCSDDCTVKLWKIPDNGLVTPMNDWWLDLHGHTRRVGYLEWHPTANNVLLSAGFDYKCIIWNVEQAEPINIVGCHTTTIFSMTWNREGSLFATTSKDKKLRTIDPRTCTLAMETTCHEGPKASKAVFVDNGKIATTGFSRMSQRLLALWDLRNSQTPVDTVELDNSCGVILPYYDYDTRIVFLAGKGDGSIKYFEFADSSFQFLNMYQSSSPQRSLGMMPKRGCDHKRCEIVRFYKLHAAKNLVEPISMIVPRKSDGFQEDIYPPTASPLPSLQADEWTAGQNREPILMSVLDGSIVSSPQTTTSKAVQKQDSGIHQAPTITTYKAVDRHQHQPTTHSSFPHPHQRHSGVGVARRMNDRNNDSSQEPASLKNIKRLSLNEDIVVVPGLSATVSSSVSAEEKRVTPPGAEPSTNGVSEYSQAFQSNKFQSSSSSSSSSSPFGHQSMTVTMTSQLKDHGTSNAASSGRMRRPVTRSQTMGGSSGAGSRPSDSAEDTSALTSNNTFHIRKTWPNKSATPPSLSNTTTAPSTASPTASATSTSTTTTTSRDTFPGSDPELKKAYFQQMAEIGSLREQITLKDKRIRQLESELSLLRGQPAGSPASTEQGGESAC